MHPRLEEKFDQYLDNTGQKVNAQYLQKHYVEIMRLFKSMYINKNYINKEFHIVPHKITKTYDWENDCPTDELLVLLASEKI
jgi:hypothetical protein